ncbi:MAG: hypothetical protein ABFS12_13115, partial [Bacteroidota bacterium]
MRYLKQIILLQLLLTITIIAQKKNFTMEDVVFNSKTTLAPTTLKNLQWIPNEYSYSYVEKIDNNDEVLIKGHATSGMREEIISLNNLSENILNYS